LGLSIYSSTTPDTKKGGFGTPNFSIFNLTRKKRKRDEEDPVQVFVYIIYFCKKQKTGKITGQKRPEQDRKEHNTPEKAEFVLIDRYAMRYILIFFSLKLLIFS